MAKGMIEGTSLARSRIYSKSEGFTLVELAVALVIVAILAGFAGAEISSWNPGKRLKGAAKELYANLQTARMKAVAENKDWAVVFDNTVGSQGYYLCSDNGTDDDWSTIGDNTCKPVIKLPVDENNAPYVYYGTSIATTDISGVALPDPPPKADVITAEEITYSADVVIFNPRGTGNAGYVYLNYVCKPQDDPPPEGYCTDSTYAVGSLTSGSIRLRKWDKVASTWN